MLGADIDPDLRIQSLSRTEKSLVAIARALAAEAEILVLDEPTASLPADEVARLFTALRRLRARGVGMIYVSHRLDEVFEIADRMVVLRDGRVAGERAVSPRPRRRRRSCSSSAASRRRSSAARRSARAWRACILDAIVMEGVGPVDCAIHAGEVVGLVGLRGAGQETVGRALFGLARHRSAAASCSTARRSPRVRRARRWRSGINLVCADRVGESVDAQPDGPREPLPQSRSPPGRSLFSLSARAARPAPRIELGRQVGLRPNDPTLPIELLSGGNQQKVVVGRWLHLGAKVYVFEDPTAGVDVGAKAEIYRLFDVALQGGRGDRHRLDRFRGGRQGLPPRAGLRSRPRGRRARRRRSLGREPARRRLGQHRPSAAAAQPSPARGDGHAVH